MARVMQAKLDDHPLLALIIGVFCIYCIYTLIGSGASLAQNAVAAFSTVSPTPTSAWDAPCAAPIPLVVGSTGDGTRSLPTIEHESVRYPDTPITASAISDVTLLAKWGAGEGGRYEWAMGAQPVADMVLLSNSNRIALATEAGVQVRHLANGTIGCTAQDIDVSDLALSLDQTQIASNNRKGEVRVWAVENGILSHNFTLPHPIATLSFTPKGTELLTFADSERTLVTPLTAAPAAIPAKWLAEIKANDAYFHQHLKGTRVATIEKEIVIIRNAVGRTTETIPLNFAYLKGAFSADGTRLALAGNQGMGVWDLAEGQPIWKSNRANAHINDIVFSPDGTWIATVSNYNGDISLWDAHDGTLLGKLEGHLEYVVALELAPDGTYLLSASRDGTIGVWGIP
jgi:WD40 repeat protein